MIDISRCYKHWTSCFPVNDNKKKPKKPKKTPKNKRKANKTNKNFVYDGYVKTINYEKCLTNISLCSWHYRSYLSIQKKRPPGKYLRSSVPTWDI